MSGMSLRGKALWRVPVLAVVGAGVTGCTIKDQTRIEGQASARPAFVNPATPAARPTAGGPVAVADAR